MDRKDGKRRVNWFLIAGCIAIVTGLIGLPALASVAGQAGSWVAALTVLAVVGLLTLMMEESWRHSPH